MALAISYYILSQGIYAGIITGISTMTLGACRLIGSIYQRRNPNISENLNRLDIEYQLRLIDSIFKKFDVQSEKNIEIKSEKGPITFLLINKPDIHSTDPIEISLGYISKSVEDIHSTLAEIDQVVAYHNTKWFNSWRPINIKKQLKSLEQNSIVLKNRFDSFIKVCDLIDKRYFGIVDTTRQVVPVPETTNKSSNELANELANEQTIESLRKSIAESFGKLT